MDDMDVLNIANNAYVHLFDEIQKFLKEHQTEELILIVADAIKH